VAPTTSGRFPAPFTALQGVTPTIFGLFMVLDGGTLDAVGRSLRHPQVSRHRLHLNAPASVADHASEAVNAWLASPIQRQIARHLAGLRSELNRRTRSLPQRHRKIAADSGGSEKNRAASPLTVPTVTASLSILRAVTSPVMVDSANLSIVVST